MKFMSLALLVPLAILIVDDMRRREVSVLWLIVLAAGTIAIPLMQESSPYGWQYGWREVLTRSGFNLLVVIYMGIGVTAWAWIKARRFVNPINTCIGLGDVLFFAVLVPLFPVRQYSYLLVGSMVFSLVWWIAARRLPMRRAETQRSKAHSSNKEPVTIPLVATSGIATSIAIILNLFIK